MVNLKLVQVGILYCLFHLDEVDLVLQFLDVTNPILKDGKGPLHMFTVYNDYINNVVYIADYEGKTDRNHIHLVM